MATKNERTDLAALARERAEEFLRKHGICRNAYGAPLVALLRSAMAEALEAGAEICEEAAERNHAEAEKCFQLGLSPQSRILATERQIASDQRADDLRALASGLKGGA